jgi:hypothetical protein
MSIDNSTTRTFEVSGTVTYSFTGTVEAQDEQEALEAEEYEFIDWERDDDSALFEITDVSEEERS